MSLNPKKRKITDSPDEDEVKNPVDECKCHPDSFLNHLPILKAPMAPMDLVMRVFNDTIDEFAETADVVMRINVRCFFQNSLAIVTGF